MIVEGIGTSEIVDTDGEVIDYESAKACMPDYMQWANAREMHQPSAVGTILSYTADDSLKTISLKGRIVDPVAKMKVKEGVYKGWSIGAQSQAKVKNRLFLKRINEYSVVDRPANPQARLTVSKRDDVQKPGNRPPNMSECMAAVGGSADDAGALCQWMFQNGRGFYATDREESVEEASAAYAASKEASVKSKNAAVEKCMQDVGFLSGIIEQLGFLANHAALETQMEGDEDPLGALPGVIQELVGLLKDVVEHETQELIESLTVAGGEPPAPEEEPMAEGATPPVEAGANAGEVLKGLQSLGEKLSALSTKIGEAVAKGKDAATHVPVAKADLAEAHKAHAAMKDALEKHKEAGTMTDDAHKDISGHHEAMHKAIGSYMEKAAGSKPADKPADAPPAAPANEPPPKDAAAHAEIEKLMAENARLRRQAAAPVTRTVGLTIVSKGEEVVIEKGQTPKEQEALDDLRKRAREGDKRAAADLVGLVQKGVLGRPPVVVESARSAPVNRS